MLLKIHFFGPFRMIRGDEALHISSSSLASSLLAYVLENRGKSHSRVKLAGYFWPDMEESRARHALSQTLWQIGRSNLGIEGDMGKLLLADREFIRVNPNVDLE